MYTDIHISAFTLYREVELLLTDTSKQRTQSFGAKYTIYAVLYYDVLLTILCYAIW